MNLEILQIPAFVTVFLALISLVLIPASTMAMSRLPADASQRNGDTVDGAACDLPPLVEVEGDGNSSTADGAPPLDREAAKDYLTATFAMG